MISSLTLVFALFASPININDAEKDNIKATKIPKNSTLDCDTKFDNLTIARSENEEMKHVAFVVTRDRRKSSIGFGPNLTAHIEARSSRKSSIVFDGHIDVVKKTSCNDINLVEKMGILTLLKSKEMFLYCLVHIFFELAYYSPMVYLPEMINRDRGIPQELAGTIISVYGMFITNYTRDTDLCDLFFLLDYSSNG